MLKQEKVTMTTITKAQLKEIYDIACSSWKTKIADYAKRDLFGDSIELSESEVDEMFNAATTEQKPVLEKIFGKKQFMLFDMKHGQVAEAGGYFVIRLNNHFIFLLRGSDTLTSKDHVLLEHEFDNIPCTLLDDDEQLDLIPLQY